MNGRGERKEKKKEKKREGKGTGIGLWGRPEKKWEDEQVRRTMAAGGAHGKIGRRNKAGSGWPGIGPEWAMLASEVALVGRCWQDGANNNTAGLGLSARLSSLGSL